MEHRRSQPRIYKKSTATEKKFFPSFLLFFIVLFALGWNLPPPDSNTFVEDIRNQLKSASRNSSFDQKVLATVKKNVHGYYRIAILIPFLSGREQSILPNYFPIFLRTAQGSASLIDFIIPHDGKLTQFIDKNTSTIQGISIPTNVKFIDLKSIQGMANFLLRVVDSRLKEKSRSEQQDLLNTIALHLRSNPYSLVEFKPALGHIFAEFIPKEKYSHWGYSDLDIVFGDCKMCTQTTPFFVN